MLQPMRTTDHPAASVMPRRNVAKARKKIGKANPLHGQRWPCWLRHVAETCGGKYHLALWLTQCFCIRITQALMLRVTDIQVKRARVWVGPFKGHEGAWKPIVPSVMSTWKKFMKRGVPGKHGPYYLPKTGWLFPAKAGAKQPADSHRDGFLANQVRQSLSQLRGFASGGDARAHEETG